MLEQGKFYIYNYGPKTKNPLIVYECLYIDENVAVLKQEMSYSFAVMKNTFDKYIENVPKLGGSGHLVVFSYKSFDETVGMVKAFYDGEDLKEYLNQMTLLEYKVISITPVSWEENQS